MTSLCFLSQCMSLLGYHNHGTFEQSLLNYHADCPQSTQPQLYKRTSTSNMKVKIPQTCARKQSVDTHGLRVVQFVLSRVQARAFSETLERDSAFGSAKNKNVENTTVLDFIPFLKNTGRPGSSHLDSAHVPELHGLSSATLLLQAFHELFHGFIGDTSRSRLLKMSLIPVSDILPCLRYVKEWRERDFVRPDYSWGALILVASKRELTVLHKRYNSEKGTEGEAERWVVQKAQVKSATNNRGKPAFSPLAATLRWGPTGKTMDVTSSVGVPVSIVATCKYVLASPLRVRRFDNLLNIAPFGS